MNDPSGHADGEGSDHNTGSGSGKCASAEDAATATTVPYASHEGWRDCTSGIDFTCGSFNNDGTGLGNASDNARAIGAYDVQITPVR